jgi:hypothetical protein
LTPDDPVGQRVQIADVLAGDVVGGVAFLAVAGLVEAQDERRCAQGLAQEAQPSLPEGLHRPLGMGQEVVEGLWVGVDGLAEAWQRLASRLGQEAEVQGSKLLEVPHVMEQVAIPRAVVVNESHRWGSWARLAHAEASFRWLRPADSVPNMTEDQHASQRRHRP